MVPTVVQGEQIERILAGFRADTHVREALPGGGVINLDRKLPFIIVHRQSSDDTHGGAHGDMHGDAHGDAHGGAEDLARLTALGEASYLLSGGADEDALRPLLLALARTTCRRWISRRPSSSWWPGRWTSAAATAPR